MPSAFSVLVKRRGLIKGAISRASEFVKNITTHSTELLKNRLAKLEDGYKEFLNITNQMLELDGADDYVDPATDLADYEGKYFEIQAAFAYEIHRRAQSELAQPQSATDPSETLDRLALQQETFFERLNHAESRSPLATVKIPMFSGSYEDWPSFRDLFTSAVHNKTSLSNVQRFHYLKSYLSAEALQLIKHLAITEDNYSAAWERLTNRYDRKQLIVKSFILTFFSLPVMHNQNAATLRKLSDSADEVIRGLDALKVTQRDPWLIQILLNKLDDETKRNWAELCDGKRDETFADFMTFLAHRCEVLEALPSSRSSRKIAVTNYVNHQPKPEQTKCVYCSEPHRISQCPTFAALSITNRRATVTQRRLCFNCLSKSHQVQKCKSTFRCRRCAGLHHTLVHLENRTPAAVPISADSVSNSPQTANHSVQDHPCVTAALLPTAVVLVRDKWNRMVQCRALLDSGSTATFVTESFSQCVGWPRSNARISILGLSSCHAGVSRGLIDLCLASRVSTDTLHVSALVLPKLTARLPYRNLEQSPSSSLYASLPLADPNFAQPGRIDMLIGADYLGDIYNGETKKWSSGSLVAMNTIFGWVLLGPCASQDDLYHSPLTVNHAMVDIDHLAHLFMEMESIEPVSVSHIQDPAEIHFVRTHTRDEDGSYIVNYPMKDRYPPIMTTLEQTFNRLRQMERRFKRNPELHTQYKDFLQEYEALGHMELISKKELETSSTNPFYLAHHAVIKTDSSTTKCRVVFDGSCKDSSGISLNDRMLIGPPIQRDLFGVMLRFRQHQFVFTADIEKMFRGIKVARDHQDLQRIIWRPDESYPVQHYRLLTVTYGLTASPFLAVRVLEQLALDYKDKFPVAAKVLLNDAYVDDILTGCDTVLGLIHLKDELLQLLSKANFKLRKFASNCKELIDAIPPDLRETGATSIQTFDARAIKVLGSQWRPASDDFSLKVGDLNENPITKRLVLSEMSKIYDPLGIVAPIIVLFKVLFQQLWQYDLDWDDPLPVAFSSQWDQYTKDLGRLSEVRVPRHIGIGCDQFELHGFADASSNACAAVVYSRYHFRDTFHTCLIAAKTRVAPLKPVSIPRLELNAAVLLVRLLGRVCSAFNTNIKFTCWTDSEIVLHWLAAPPKRWQTFVCNRVGEILEFSPRELWKHVRSEDNPADCASRGMLPVTLLSHHQWWQGPSWLTSSEDQWPESTWSLKVAQEDICLEERRSKLTVLTAAAEDHVLDELISKLSTWSRLIRVMAYCLRFVAACHGEKPHQRYLTIRELSLAQDTLIRHVQHQAFARDIRQLQNSEQVSPKSPLSRLAPFLDVKQVIRVGGRIKHSTLMYNMKHPIILPKDSHLSLLLVRHVHRVNLHSGMNTTFVNLRQHYWVLGSRRLVRKVVFSCICCFKQRRSQNPQLMGDLPPARVQAHRCFLHCGLDYAGPITLKQAKGRNPRHSKAWFAIFICLSVKAMHIELVSDLTTDAFLAAFRRFVARRGKPTDLYSDNGTTFRGALRELKELHSSALSEANVEKISELLANDGIRWHFIPPSSPHFGGLWEAGVRSVKLHLRRVIGDAILTFEEYSTVLSQVEAILNSRPLCPISDDDLDPLTPAHFLIGAPYTALPEPTLLTHNNNTLKRWRFLQALVQGFWLRWHREYLTSLQHRPKWQKLNSSLRKGDLVVVKEPNLPPAKWVLGRIIEAITGPDGIVRVARVKTARGEYLRPAMKLVPLPTS